MLGQPSRGCKVDTSDRDIEFARKFDPVRPGLGVCVGVVWHKSMVSVRVRVRVRVRVVVNHCSSQAYQKGICPTRNKKG